MPTPAGAPLRSGAQDWRRDDAAFPFEYEEDARRVMAVLPKRFGKYGLTLHPDKTRLVPFKRPDRMPRTRGGDGPDKPGTFDFLGFTVHWGKSPITGKWVVKTRTAATASDER